VSLSSCVTHIRQAPSDVTILIGEQPLALFIMHLQPLPPTLLRVRSVSIFVLDVLLLRTVGTISSHYAWNTA
jgi:hypothetical protein